MADKPYDKGSKWLLEHQARAMLLLGGLTNVRGYTTKAGQIVQPTKLPDGLLAVKLDGRKEPLPVLVEVATYPDDRAAKQATQDLTLAYNALGRLPELLLLVLRPRGNQRVPSVMEVVSTLGMARLRAEWKVIELWTLSAEQYLLVPDVGIVPWLTLMHYDGPPEELLERCCERIEREAAPKQQAGLKAVAQVMAQLKFPHPDLYSILGGRATMLESPLLQELRADIAHDMILDLLKSRFPKVPRDVIKHLRAILDEKKLTRLNTLASVCPDMATFKEALLS